MPRTTRETFTMFGFELNTANSHQCPNCQENIAVKFRRHVKYCTGKSVRIAFQ